MITPMEFIPILERSTDIFRIDFYMLEQVCQKMRTWIDKNYNVVPISINLSRQHLQKDETLSRISEVVSKYEIPVNLLEFELTESAMFEKMVFLADFGQKKQKSGKQQKHIDKKCFIE